MATIKRVLRCYRCGQILQSSNPKMPGYISSAELKASGKEDALRCSSCYEAIKALNFSQIENDAWDRKTAKILDYAASSDAVIVWVVDLFAFNGTLNPEVVKKVRGQKVVVLGTRRDLLPKASDATLTRFLQERFSEYGIEPVAIRLVGVVAKMPSDEMLKNLREIRQGHDVYMVGAVNSGKRAVIDRLLKIYANNSGKEIETKNYPKTSVQVFEVPFTKSSSFYELPGFSQSSSVVGKVESSILKYIVPKKEVKAEIRSLGVGDALMIGSLAAFTLVKGKSPLTVKVYVAEGVEMKKVKDRNLMDEIRENAEKKNLRPVSERFSSFQDYDLFEYVMENDGQSHDISVSGLVWISFLGKGQTIRVLLPKGVAVKESLSKIR